MSEPIYYTSGDTTVRDTMSFNSKIILDSFFNLQNVNFATVNSVYIENFGQVIDENGRWVGSGSITYGGGTGGGDVNTSTTIYVTEETINISDAISTAKSLNSSVTIYVYPGTYILDGNEVVPDNVSLISVSGPESTIIQASDTCRLEKRNMFLVGSGCCISGFTFINQEIDDLESPTGGFAIAFNPDSKINVPPIVKDCIQKSYSGDLFAPPASNPTLGNPLVGNGGGMILADRAFIGNGSIHPYFLVSNVKAHSPNGIGFVAKNGAGIYGNLLSCEYQRCGYLSLYGGQIVVNGSTTKYGDIGFKSSNKIDFVVPYSTSRSLVPSTTIYDSIINSLEAGGIDSLWTQIRSSSPSWETNISLDELSLEQEWQYLGEFVIASQNNDWNNIQEAEFKLFAERLYRSIAEDIRAGDQDNSRAFAASLYRYEEEDGPSLTSKVIPDYMMNSYIYTLGVARDTLQSLTGSSYIHSNMIAGYIDDIIIPTLNTPILSTLTSYIKSSSHNFFYSGSGVNVNAMPDYFGRTGSTKNPKFTMIRENSGKIHWSGTDENNNHYLADGTEVDGYTGQFRGRRITSQFRREARRMVNARSYR